MLLINLSEHSGLDHSKLLWLSRASQYEQFVTWSAFAGNTKLTGMCSSPPPLDFLTNEYHNKKIQS